MPKSKRPCENCGGTQFINQTISDEVKGLITRVAIESRGLKLNRNSGTPVDIIACTACGCVRLFLVTKNPIAPKG